MAEGRGYRGGGYRGYKKTVGYRKGILGVAFNIGEDCLG